MQKWGRQRLIGVVQASVRACRDPGVHPDACYPWVLRVLVTRECQGARYARIQRTIIQRCSVRTVPNHKKGVAGGYLQCCRGGAILGSRGPDKSSCDSGEVTHRGGGMWGLWVYPVHPVIPGDKCSLWIWPMSLHTRPTRISGYRRVIGCPGVGSSVRSTGGAPVSVPPDQSKPWETCRPRRASSGTRGCPVCPIIQPFLSNSIHGPSAGRR